ncbi:MAG: gas vesicle protein [Firmicutes bacterium]|uniref:Gas vesicle protein n=1 Tax=Sulfobacillus benefaciens TaxID=453960 RepID=A0A2T2WWV2_9FIRM|nr:gas vesicle protein [Bacillota bacterium]MCL5013743.1 gas vesicle protein [Bacillota bacterium]PSR26727.1 MAG: gas vesicle protein [Sulfobacillus benefaciens]HBQ95106.1 gas vesicle protein [Sulfobacillus sp.]
MDEVLTEQNVTLLDLLDRIIDHGVVIQGELKISVAEVDLIYINVKLLVSSISQLRRNQNDEDNLTNDVTNS